MGLKFRKSKKIASGVRLNFSKKGVGVSFGGKRVRYSISPTGRRTTSFKIAPGLTYSTSSSGKSQRKKRRTSSTNSAAVYQNPQKQVKASNATASIIFVVILVLLWTAGTEINLNLVFIKALSIIAIIVFVTFMLINNIPPLKTKVLILFFNNKAVDDNSNNVIIEPITPPTVTKNININVRDINIIDQAANAVIDAGQVSISYLQRKLKIGYAHTAKIVEELELLGVISLQNDSKPRQVLVTKEMWEQLKNNIV